MIVQTMTVKLSVACVGDL